MNPDIQSLIGKLVTDHSFRKSFFEDPEKFFDQYNLSEEEQEALKNLDSEKLQAFAESLDERITKAFTNIG